MADELCSKCGKELRASGKDPWCKTCRAAYQREYQNGRSERGFSAGAEAMRSALRAKIRQAPPQSSTTYGSIDAWLKEFPAPEPG